MDTENEEYNLNDLFSEIPIKKERKMLKEPQNIPKSGKNNNTERKKKGAAKADARLQCNICGTETSYRYLNEHRNTKYHKSKLTELKEEKRKKLKKEEQKAQKREDIKTRFVSLSIAVAETPSKTNNWKQIKEFYKLRTDDRLPELHHLYLLSLSTFLALRCCFNGDNRDFRLSTTNSLWNEFGDIVIEFLENEELDEIQAIQCKQTQRKSKILVPTLGSEMGKFSIKTRCDILKKLKTSSNTKNYFEKAFFKIFTISSLSGDKEDISKFVYDDKVVENWKHQTEQDTWRYRQLKISEYKKMNPLNTTDEPADIYVFKIVDERGKTLMEDLNKFSLFTNQLKLKNLKKSIEMLLRNRFNHKEEISSDLIQFVKHFFKTTEPKHCPKLSKKVFSFKIAELLLEPFVAYPEKILLGKKFNKWIDLIKGFDIIVVKNGPEIVSKIYSTLNGILLKKTELDKDSNLINLWKEKKVPLVVCTDDVKELKLVIRVISSLHEENLMLGFIIVTNLSIDEDLFPENLNVFFSWKDLEREGNKLLWDDLLNEIEVKFFNSVISLKEILQHNEDFSEKNTPDTLINMLLNEYAFEKAHQSMDREVTDEVLILNDKRLKGLKNDFKNDEENQILRILSYTINVKGKPMDIEVDPEI